MEEARRPPADGPTEGAHLRGSGGVSLAGSKESGGVILGSVAFVMEDGSDQRPAADVAVEAFLVDLPTLQRFDPEWVSFVIASDSEAAGDRHIPTAYGGGESVYRLEPSGLRRVTTTDADGRFQFQDLGEGWWVVRVLPAAVSAWQMGTWRQRQAGRLVHASRTGVHTLPLELVERFPAQASITGWVVDDADRPVAGVSVFAYRVGVEEGLGDETAADGSFSLGPVGDWKWNVLAMPESGHGLLRSAIIQARQGQEIQLVLPSAASLSGIAVDAETGQPAPVLGASAVAGEGRSPRHGTTSYERFEIQHLEPGTYLIYVQGLEDCAGLLRDVRVGEAEHAAELVVPLERAMHLEVVVKPGSGPRLVGVSLPGGAPFVLDQARAGSVTIPLPPGDYVLGTYVPLGLDALETLSTWPCGGRAGEHVRIEL